MELTPIQSPPAGVSACNFHPDVTYGNHALQKVDFYLPTTGSNFAVALFLHGGGFIGGDKDSVSPSFVNTLLAAGIGVISVNYRLNATDGSERKGGIKAFKDAVYLIQSLKYYSAGLGINPAKIGAYGKSAGGGLCLYLNFYEDRGQRSNSLNPVKQLSSRIMCAAAQRPQASYWVTQWERKIFPDNASFIALTQSQDWADVLQQFYGLSNPSDIDNREYINYGKKLHYSRYICSTNPEWYLINDDNEGTPGNTNVAFHDPRHAKFLYDKAIMNGSPVNAYIQVYSIAHANNETIEQFLIRKLS